jgi:hypothetical protein
MLKFSKAQLERAKSFLFEQGRTVEQCIFTFEFERGPQAAAIQGLRGYANPDGGFGHALEPDVRAPYSSALATSSALRDLKRLGASTKEPLVLGALTYLSETLDRDTLTWRFIPEEAEHYPHAPWWSQQGGALERTFDHFRLNPRAELVALLWHWSEDTGIFPRKVLVALSESTLAALSASPPKDPDGVRCVYALATEPLVPEPYRLAARHFLREQGVKQMQRSREALHSYGLPPLLLAPTPASPVLELVRDAVQMQLEDLIAVQAEDGSWTPNWSWGETYPKAWARAEREWRSLLTLQNLRFLRDYSLLPRPA